MAILISGKVRCIIKMWEKYKFPKLSAEVDNVNRPVIMKEMERFKKKSCRTGCSNIDKKVQIHPIHFMNLI